MTVEVSWSTDKAAVQRLSRLSSVTGKPAMRQIARVVVEQTRERIQTEKRDPDGHDWDKWSLRYAATRGEHHSLLQDTNDLFRSIGSRVFDDRAIVGSDRRYARIHQEGGKKMPRHSFLGLSRQNREDIEDTIERFIASAIGRR